MHLRTLKHYAKENKVAQNKTRKDLNNIVYFLYPFFLIPNSTLDNGVQLLELLFSSSEILLETRSRIIIGCKRFVITYDYTRPWFYKGSGKKINVINSKYRSLKHGSYHNQEKWISYYILIIIFLMYILTITSLWLPQFLYIYNITLRKL